MPQFQCRWFKASETLRYKAGIATHSLASGASERPRDWLKCPKIPSATLNAGNCDTLRPANWQPFADAPRCFRFSAAVQVSDVIVGRGGQGSSMATAMGHPHKPPAQPLLQIDARARPALESQAPHALSVLLTISPRETAKVAPRALGRGAGINPHACHAADTAPCSAASLGRAWIPE